MPESSRFSLNGPPPVRARGVVRRFGAHRVLDGVDLDVAWGEAVALVGSNGAGKTTLLRILAGSLRPQQGRAELAGERAGTDPARRQVALLSGDAYLYEDLTAAENLRFALDMSGRPRSRKSVEAALTLVGLDAVADRRARFFSSGMRKRLALARVLALDPPILLLDEPYASLDREASRLIDTVIQRWQAPDRALVMATHRRGRARRTCNRVLSLSRGGISPVEGGRPARDPEVPMLSGAAP